MKPGDFFVGVVDFFSALLPGALATWLVLQYVDPADLARWSLETDSDFVRGGAILLSSYILGHFAVAVGGSLDDVYDRWRQRNHPKESDLAYKAAVDLRKRLSPEFGDNTAVGAFSIFKWARAYVTIHAPQARSEIDALEANSKFFRTLVVVFALVTAHFLIREQRLGIAAASAVLAFLSFRRFCDQRWKLTELSFATAVILHGTKLSPDKPPASIPGSVPKRA